MKTDKAIAASVPRSLHSNDASATDYVRIGRIVRPIGLRGAMRVRLDDPASTTLLSVKRVVLELDDEHRHCVIRSTAPAGRGAVKVELDGIESCDAAEKFRNASVMVWAEDLPSAAPEEFYNYRAIGCEVIAASGERLGSVSEIFPTGANDVLVVRDGNREVLVPVIADVIKAMDFVARRITIELVPGLLD